MRSGLPELSKPKTARRFVGSAVPVTKVHVPKQSLPEPEMASDAVTSAPARPLFAKVKKQAAKKLPTMRVGQRERMLLAVFFVLILLAVGIAAVIFLPKADITLALQSAPLLVDERLTLSPGAPVDEHTIPGTAFFREVKVEATSPVTTREIVGTKATGSVEIVNRANEEQKIKERSRLVTKDGTLFYMIGHVIVPAAEGGSPRRATVQVEAAEAGDKGNITPQRLDFAALDKSSQTLVYAENPRQLAGGTGESVAVIAESDIEAAKKAAQEAARQQAEQEIRSEVPSGWMVLEESWTGEVTSFETTAKVGERQESIPYSALVKVRVLGYEDAQMQAALQRALNAKLDPEYMLFPGAISFTKSVEKVDWDKPEATVAARITHTTVPNISLETLQAKLAGRDREEALKYLQGLKGVKSASIELWPFWVTNVPSIEKRVIIDVQQGQ